MTLTAAATTRRVLERSIALKEGRSEGRKVEGVEGRRLACTHTPGGRGEGSE